MVIEKEKPLFSLYSEYQRNPNMELAKPQRILFMMMKVLYNEDSFSDEGWFGLHESTKDALLKEALDVLKMEMLDYKNLFTVFDNIVKFFIQKKTLMYNKRQGEVSGPKDIQLLKDIRKVIKES